MLQFLSGLFYPLISALKSLLTQSAGQDTESSPSASLPGSSNSPGLTMSQAGQKVLKYFEQCKLKAYWDATGKVWTIGWGDTGPDVVEGLVITQAEADRRLANRLAREFVPAVLSAITQPMLQHQFDAMVDLAYNIGVGAFRGSTLVRTYNTGDTASAADEFLRWNRSGGKVLLGLRRRRAANRALFLGASAAEAIKIGAAIV